MRACCNTMQPSRQGGVTELSLLAANPSNLHHLHCFRMSWKNMSHCLIQGFFTPQHTLSFQGLRRVHGRGSLVLQAHIQSPPHSRRYVAKHKATQQRAETLAQSPRSGGTPQSSLIWTNQARSGIAGCPPPATSLALCRSSGVQAPAVREGHNPTLARILCEIE